MTNPTNSALGSILGGQLVLIIDLEQILADKKLPPEVVVQWALQAVFVNTSYYILKKKEDFIRELSSTPLTFE